MVERYRDLAERCRALVEKVGSADCGEAEVSVTISIGGHALIVPGDSADSVVKRADQLMYASKLGGRNRATVR